MFTLKKLLYSSFTLIIICFFNNCNKRNDTKVKGHISFEFNGAFLKIESNKDGIISYSKIKNGSIGIFATPLLNKGIILTCWGSTDTIALRGATSQSNGNCYILNDAGGGAFCNLYHLDTRDSLNNWIKIDEENNDFRHIIGQFSATLFKDSVKCSFGNPYGDVDTLRIRNGKFDICD